MSCVVWQIVNWNEWYEETTTNDKDETAEHNKTNSQKQLDNIWHIWKLITILRICYLWCASTYTKF